MRFFIRRQVFSCILNRLIIPFLFNYYWVCPFEPRTISVLLKSFLITRLQRGFVLYQSLRFLSLFINFDRFTKGLWRLLEQDFFCRMGLFSWFFWNWLFGNLNRLLDSSFNDISRLLIGNFFLTFFFCRLIRQHFWFRRFLFHHFTGNILF